MPLYPSDTIKAILNDGRQLDAFNRLRTSAPHTVFDSINEYNTSPVFFETTLAGAGASTHLPNESSVLLAVGTASGDSAIRQSREYFRYVPGKSQAVFLTSVLGVPKTNVRQRVGYFDASNGLFFECNGSTFGVAIRSKASGSVVDTRVAQSAFNIDKLDGTGPSGITIDLSKDNLFVIDFQWLGGGRVRFGVYGNDGILYYCHQFLNANVATTVYMTTGNLPVRAEITNTGIAASGTEMRITCFSVISEDANESTTGIPASAATGTTLTAVTTRRAVLSIRPKATFNSIVNRGLILNLGLEMIAKTNDAYFEIVYNGAIGGVPSWTSVGDSSIAEYDVAGTTVTGGIVVGAGFIVSGTGSTADSTNHSLLSKLPLTLDSSGANPINISIVCTSFTGTSNVGVAAEWLEIY